MRVKMSMVCKDEHGVRRLLVCYTPTLRLPPDLNSLQRKIVLVGGLLAEDLQYIMTLVNSTYHLQMPCASTAIT